MENLSKEQAWDILQANFNVSDETLKVVTNINGFSLETMEDVLYAVSGYRNFEQLED
jgi:hypothetical protein